MTLWMTKKIAVPPVLAQFAESNNVLPQNHARFFKPGDEFLIKLGIPGIRSTSSPGLLNAHFRFFIFSRLGTSEGVR